MDWTRFYQTDPRNFNGTEQQKDLVLGGEGAWWTEYIDSSGILSRSFPRLSAIAERLWSDYEKTKDLEPAYLRINKLRCLMIKRGIPAEPGSVPSSCDCEFDVGYKKPWEYKEDLPSSAVSSIRFWNSSGLVGNTVNFVMKFFRKN